MAKRPTAKKKAKAKVEARAKAKASAKATTRRSRRSAPAANFAALQIKEIESLRRDVERRSAELLPRWNANPEDVQKSVAQLVLALVEFLRKLLERQAIRRMEAESLDPEEVERVGLALMRLEEAVHDIARRFGLEPEDLNLDLGPLGRLS